jgi:glycosyltransferase involved in cell wall biosynthesis
MTFLPDITIIMPCYQQAPFLEEAVRSVLDQQGVTVELIVMDPGSTDGSRDLLRGLHAEYGDHLVLHFAPDDGQADAVNRGMVMARGTILGWLNSDDRLRPGALAIATAYLNTPEPHWLYGRGGIIDAQGRQISQPIVWYKNWRGRRFSRYKLITEDFIPQMSTFWNRALWDKAGGLDINRHLDMDYDLFLRFAAITDPVVSTSYLADFRVHRQTKSSQQTAAHLAAAMATAREHSRGLGLRGELAFLFHRIYSARTRLVYRFIKP